MGALWPFVLLTTICAGLSLYLVRKRHYNVTALACVMVMLSFYYAQGPDDIDFVKLWGRPLAAFLYVAIFAHLTVLYLIERRK